MPAVLRRQLQNVFAAMAQLGVSDGPDEDKAVLHGMPSRSKMEPIDQLPPVISISVVTGNGLEASVTVLPSWFDRGVPQSELANDSINLLLETPPAVSAPFAPLKNPMCHGWLQGTRFEPSVTARYCVGGAGPVLYGLGEASPVLYRLGVIGSRTLPLARSKPRT